MVIEEVEGQGLELETGRESELFFYVIGQGMAFFGMDCTFHSIQRQIKENSEEMTLKAKIFPSGLSEWQELEILLE